MHMEPMHLLIHRQEAILQAAQACGTEFYDLSLLSLASHIGTEAWHLEQPCEELLLLQAGKRRAFVPLVADRAAFYRAVTAQLRRGVRYILMPYWLATAVEAAVGCKAGNGGEDRIADNATLQDFSGHALARYRRYMRKVTAHPDVEICLMEEKGLGRAALPCLEAWYANARANGTSAWFYPEHRWLLKHWDWLRANFQEIKGIAVLLEGKVTAVCLGSRLSERMWCRHMDRYDGRLACANFQAFSKLACMFADCALANDGVVGVAQGLAQVKQRTAPMAIPTLSVKW
jgi:hypothetical protein